MPETPAAALLSLLEEERAAITTAAFSALPGLAHQKVDLAKSVTATGTRPADMMQIDRCLRRNARLLAAACEGIGAAQDRLAALKDVRNGLNLYTAAGDRTTVARRPGALEHKV